MTTIYDVPADSLISEIAKELSENKKITPQNGRNSSKQGFIKREDPKILIGGMCAAHLYFAGYT
ncbi:hypothetical protein GCM10025861_26520 [Methanobacterium petrolearium]|nr:hypothetical protein GCM10025861_26520 [Methanobacterium petrolearium]